MKISKKAQMEIMGLAIIVLLLSFGMLLVFRFVLLKPAEQPRETFTETQMASNILSSILRTSSGCRSTDMTELLQDCATTPIILCQQSDAHTNIQQYFTSHFSEVNSCEYAEASLKYIFNQTFEEWKQKYNFIAYLDDINNPIMQLNNSICIGEKQVKEFPIPTTSGRTLFVRFEICS